MKVTYIYHSCFLVEMKKSILLFDWFQGEIPALDPTKNLYVFSSHKHHDHFNLEIFAKLKDYPKVHYILSKDIRLSPNYLERHSIDPAIREQITFVGKNMQYNLGDERNPFVVRTLTSTDTGVAFVITCEGKTLYHAGDLNWWSWVGEKSEEENQMEKDYTTQINLLKGEHIDVAFVVLDPRQENRYWWGFDYFMKEVGADTVFPMHCWGDYSIIPLLKKESRAAAYAGRVATIDRENQIFLV